MEGRVPQTALFVAYPMCGQADPHFPAFDLLTDVLANGNASRMYRSLVMPGDLFSTADASVAGSEEPGYLLLSGRLLQSGADAEKRARYDELMELMASEELYADQVKFNAALGEYNGLKQELPKLEDEWLELSTQIEEETARELS